MFSTSTKIAFGYILLICLLFGAIGYIHQQMTLLTTPTGLEETISNRRKTTHQIDTPYFNYVHEHPHYHHTADERSQNTWREIILWMDVAQMLFKNNNTLLFRKQQELNFLQSILMWLFNTIPEKLAANKQYSRKQMLCHQFMQLIREHSTCEHQVPFYTEQLCITPRYLYEITTQYMNGKTPKQLIDEQLIAEAKVLLNEPCLSVTEIAELLNFADQSYLSRFFKKNTGMSPKEAKSPASQ